MPQTFKYLLALLLLLCGNLIYAQDINISSFTVQSQLPASISEWGGTPGALLLVAQNTKWGDRPVRLVIYIKRGDSRICGSDDGIAVDYFKIRTFQTNDLLAALTNCNMLQAGDYTLCARFRGMSDTRQWIDISAEICKPFYVGGGVGTTNNDQKYTAPTLIFPDNNRIFTGQDIKKPIIFRWTPVVPKPQEPIIYHLKIWQIQKGETAMQAMKATQPVVEKDLTNLTQTAIANGLFPCSSECNFAWVVQATNKEEQPYGENNGTSELFVFNAGTEPVVENVTITHPVILPCVKCNNLQINNGNPVINMNDTSGLLTLSQSLTISPDVVKQLTTDIVYIEWKPENEKCLACNKDPRQWGTIQSATLTNGGSSSAGTVLNMEESQWTINSGMTNSTVHFMIQLPALLSCCRLTGKICIRYKFVLQPANAECYECEKLICYTF